MYQTEYRIKAINAINKEKEYEVSKELLDRVGANHVADIFSEKVEKLLKDDIESKEIVDKKDIALFLFQESQLQAKQSQQYVKKQ